MASLMVELMVPSMAYKTVELMVESMVYIMV